MGAEAIRPAGQRTGCPGQLYNLAKDPGETKNLYNEHPGYRKSTERKTGGIQKERPQPPLRRSILKGELNLGDVFFGLPRKIIPVL